MREILFRGKRKDSGEMIFGCLMSENSRIQARDKENNYVSYDVMKNTIGQFTGLYDKNGTKVFEGDVLKIQLAIPFFSKKTFYAVVEFGNINKQNSWGWCLNFSNNKDFEFNPYILLWVETSSSDVACKIVGNIHENVIEDFIGE